MFSNANTVLKIGVLAVFGNSETTDAPSNTNPHDIRGVDNLIMK